MELSWFNLSVLLSLCLQNGVYSLLRRIGSASPHSWTYEDVLLIGELMKIAFSIYMSSREPNERDSGFVAKLTRLTRSSIVMLPPAIAFCFMNVFSYWALERIDTTAFTILTQLKIVSTAAMLRVFLGRRYSWEKWRAMILVMVGCVLVTSSRSNELKGFSFSYMIGCLYMLIEVTASGMANAYNEKVFKTGKSSVWDRNYQLGLWGTLLYTIRSLQYKIANNLKLAPWEGWTMLASVLSLGAASGGLLVSVAVRYTDAVMKGLAVAGSIIIVMLCEQLILREKVASLESYCGAIVVIIAISNFSFATSEDVPVVSENNDVVNAEDYEMENLVDADDLTLDRLADVEGGDHSLAHVIGAFVR